MEQTVVSLEATPGGMIETIQIADPKDPFGIRLLIREWFEAAGEANLGFYRSIEATPLPDALPKPKSPEALVPERNVLR
ncbi:hypothetical protein BH24ACT22_BH24ACT22_10740 [soil metagenome]